LFYLLLLPRKLSISILSAVFNKTLNFVKKMVVLYKMGCIGGCCFCGFRIKWGIAGQARNDEWYSGGEVIQTQKSNPAGRLDCLMGLRVKPAMT